MTETRDRYPDNKAEIVVHSDDSDLVYYVVRGDRSKWGILPRGWRSFWYCGYVRFPRRPVKESGYDGIIRFVPVHGGVTYADQDHDGSMVYGFDCGHAGDDEDPQTADPQWVLAEAKRMAVAIKLAADREDEYLEAETDNERRADILQELHDDLRSQCAIDFDLRDNFGALIGLMTGRL